MAGIGFIENEQYSRKLKLNKMENSIITFDVANITRENYKEKANQLASIVERGTVNPLDAYTRLRAIEAMVSEARKQIDAMAKIELSKYDKSEKVVFNAYEVTQREAGVSYDFSVCNDFVYGQLSESVETFKQLLKEREAFLKTIKAPTNLVSEDGEPYTIHPPIKKSTTSIVCS